MEDTALVLGGVSPDVGSSMVLLLKLVRPCVLAGRSCVVGRSCLVSVLRCCKGRTLELKEDQKLD